MWTEHSPRKHEKNGILLSAAAATMRTAAASCYTVLPSLLTLLDRRQ
jgi:hypothetical protein